MIWPWFLIFNLAVQVLATNWIREVGKYEERPVVKRQFGGGGGGGMGGAGFGGMNGFGGGNGFGGMGGGMGGMNGMNGGGMGGGGGFGNGMMGMNQGGGGMGGGFNGMNGGFGGGSGGAGMMGMGAGMGGGNGMMMNGQGFGGGMMNGGQGLGGNFMMAGQGLPGAMGAQMMPGGMGGQGMTGAMGGGFNGGTGFDSSMPMQQFPAGAGLRFGSGLGAGMGMGQGGFGGLGMAGLMGAPAAGGLMQGGFGLGNGMGVMGMNPGAGMGMNAMGGMMNGGALGALGAGGMGINGLGAGGFHPNMGGSQFVIRRRRWSKLDGHDDDNEVPKLNGKLAFASVIEALKEGTDESDDIDAQETSSCGGCVPLDLRKVTGSWTQIYGNARSLRLFYTALGSARPADSRGESLVRAAHNDTSIQPSCVGFYFGRPFPRRVSDSIVGEASFTLHFRDDAGHRPAFQFSGIVQQTLVPNEPEVNLKVAGFDMPVCLVKGGPVPGGDYDYVILMETRGKYRCRSLHVLSRNSDYFFQNYSSDIIQFLQDKVRAGEAEPVKVMPNPEQCQPQSQSESAPRDQSQDDQQDNGENR